MFAVPSAYALGYLGAAVLWWFIGPTARPWFMAPVVVFLTGALAFAVASEGIVHVKPNVRRRVRRYLRRDRRRLPLLAAAAMAAGAATCAGNILACWPLRDSWLLLALLVGLPLLGVALVGAAVGVAAGAAVRRRRLEGLGNSP